MKFDNTVEDCCICEADYSELYMDKFDDGYQVVCQNCTTSTSKVYSTKDIALQKWNDMCKFYRKRS